MINDLLEMLKDRDEIEAVALAGSRATEKADPFSDYDLYIYLKSPLDPGIRKEILEPLSSSAEINNTFWEMEDNGVFKNGIAYDLIYRNLDDFEASLSHLIDEQQVGTAYNTCLWNNLLNSKILFDRDGRLEALQKKYSIAYPKELKEAILKKDLALLDDALPNYRDQILKAVKRNDRISMLHRSSAFLETYFDLIFALNDLTHPGEKRMVSLALENCRILPENFEKNLNTFLNDLYASPENTENNLNEILLELKKLPLK